MRRSRGRLDEFSQRELDISTEEKASMPSSSKEERGWAIKIRQMQDGMKTFAATEAVRKKDLSYSSHRGDLTDLSSMVVLENLDLQTFDIEGGC